MMTSISSACWNETDDDASRHIKSVWTLHDFLYEALNSVVATMAFIDFSFTGSGIPVFNE